ncbi:polysaccharide deacetylase family protein [Chryseobacterium sp. MFBS3-17]|uniref:polysaccharide deacetylase family protein n=1 Tax=Chryseobacterium sp. MFBS3-17 TaxID=2886689 RepID=UPI001D0F0529|nr:polysaccharide deacetylase family protein [Chryseobacterium sp. MFBS3-17]MCC2591314.1 polysaccharide deacetylase family protein [Chryseobacterium sp. MFBS3-17]
MKHRFAILICLIAVALIYFLTRNLWFSGAVVIIFLALTTLGVARMDLNWFLKNYTKPPGQEERLVALTFDDGPTPLTPKFLELLNQYGQKATFFCIGKQIEQYPEVFKRTINAGHEIGNHTFSHQTKTGFLSTRAMVSEIEKADVIMEKHAGIKTDLYRPPFGITNPHIARAIQRTGKKSMGWTIRSLDTTGDSETRILNRIIPAVKPGSVILLHDTSEKTYRVLKELLVFLEQENYRSVTLSQLFDFK